MIEIHRNPRKFRGISLVSLIDVVFQLLIYFMLTTSFTRSESLELALPSAANASLPVKQAAKPKADVMHIYIADTGETFLEKDSLGESDMQMKLSTTFLDTPDRGVLVLSAPNVSVQMLVRVLDRIYTAGGKNIAVADWVIPTAPAAPAEPKGKKKNG